MSQENKNNNGNNAQDKKEEKDVSIHIDKQNLKSPNPTTGNALYQLGNVDPATLDLFREDHGKGDDELITNTTVVVNLKNGDKFYTA